MGTGGRRFENTAFGVAMALLALAGYLSYRSAAATRETSNWVTHSHRVIAELQAVLAVNVDAETARRGFALTNDQALLAPHRDAARRADDHLAELEVLVADNSSRATRLADLKRLSHERIAALDAAIATQQALGLERFRETSETLAGDALMSELRAVVAEMIAAEERLLATRQVQAHASVVRLRDVQLASGAVALALVVLVVVRLRREVRERESSEARARENEENLATTLLSIGDGVITTDRERRVTRMNPVAETITGWSSGEGSGKTIEEVFRLVHEITSNAVENPVALALRRDAVVDIDDAAVLVAKDGSKRRVEHSAAPIRSHDGSTSGAVLVFRDITKTLEDARRLRRTLAFLDSLVENLPDMLFVKKADDLVFVRMNRAGETLLGLTRDQLLGKNDAAFFPPEQAAAFIAKDRETLQGKAVLEIDEEPITTAAGVRWLHTKKVPILDEDGEPIYLLGISADVTERRRADYELRASRDATVAAHKELEAFSYSVAHDLRAPLRSIDGFSQALLDDYGEQLDEQAKDYLGRVRNSARRMAELIDDLLALARMSRSDLGRVTVDLTAVAREVGEQMKRERKADVELVVDDGLTSYADPRLVRVLLENLLSNAIKFSSRSEAARVQVGKSTANGSDAFFVKDNGAGFDLANAKKLFSAFQRYHRPSEYEGTGIGLATAQRIVARHGGRIWAESAPGRGATFHFILERGDDPE